MSLNRKTYCAALICLSAFVVCLSPAQAQKKSRIAGVIEITADVWVGTSKQWTFTGGRPQGKTLDGKYDVQADKIVVDLNTKSKSKSGALAKVTASGNAKVRVVMDDGTKVKVDAQNATYSKAEQVAVFSGNVNAVIDNPGLAEPSVVAANKITLWLAAAENQPQIKVEGAPAKATVTPRQPEKKPAPDGTKG